MNPGDKCVLFRAPNGTVYTRHIECDQHKDGVVTNPATNEIIAAREYKN